MSQSFCWLGVLLLSRFLTTASGSLDGGRWGHRWPPWWPWAGRRPVENQIWVSAGWSWHTPGVGAWCYWCPARTGQEWVRQGGVQDPRWGQPCRLQSDVPEFSVEEDVWCHDIDLELGIWKILFCIMKKNSLPIDINIRWRIETEQARTSQVW